MDQPHREGSNSPETGTAFQPYAVVTELQVLDPLMLLVEDCGVHFHFLQSAIMHTQSLRGYPQYLPFPSPQVSYPDAPFLGAQGDQSPLLPIGIGSCPGDRPRDLTLSCGVPGELVCPSNESAGAQLSGESEHRSEREPRIPSGELSLLVRLGAPRL